MQFVAIIVLNDSHDSLIRMSLNYIINYQQQPINLNNR